jgi:hypothetical protein
MPLNKPYPGESKAKFAKRSRLKGPKAKMAAKMAKHEMGESPFAKAREGY